MSAAYEGGCHWCGADAYVTWDLAEVEGRLPLPDDPSVPLCPTHVEELLREREAPWPGSGLEDDADEEEDA